MKEQLLRVPLNNPEISREDLIGHGFAQKRLSAKNRLRLQLRQLFKHSVPDSIIKTNVLGRPWIYWFHSSSLRKSQRGGISLKVCFAICRKIKRAEKLKFVLKNRLQAALYLWQQLLFVQQQTQVESWFLFFLPSVNWAQICADTLGQLL